jgi:hypothetical protein
VVAQASALDTYTNNWSLFHLVEQVRLSEFPTALPLEVHSYWKFAPDESNVAFEMRLVLVPQEGEMAVSNPVTLRSSTIRYRFRTTGLPISIPGDYEIHIEWHEPGHPEWTRCDVFWPLVVSRMSVSAQPS